MKNRILTILFSTLLTAIIALTQGPRCQAMPPLDLKALPAAPDYTVPSGWLAKPAAPLQQIVHGDVWRALTHYLKHANKGRPFFLAGHSHRIPYGERSPWCMMAIWPAGPPKLMKPSLAQNESASLNWVF